MKKYQSRNCSCESILDVLFVSLLVFFPFTATELHAAPSTGSQPRGIHGRPSAVQLLHIDSLINSNKFAEAAKTSKLLIKRYPDNAELNSSAALALLYSGDQKSAQYYAERAARLDPKNHEAHWALTNLYASQGRLDDSTRELNLAMTYRTKKHCKPCQKSSKKNLELLKSVQKSF